MEENIKIGLLKKIWYSITKPSKYEDLNKLGVKKAIKYFFTIVLILALLLAILETCMSYNTANTAINYLEEKLPEITFKENTLTLENADTIILDDKKILDYFNMPIVINTILTEDEAINEYKDLAKSNKIVIVFLKENYVMISEDYTPQDENKSGIKSQKYSEVSARYIKNINSEYSKQDLIKYFRERTSIAYFFAYFFILYFLRITFVFLLYILFVSVGVWLVTKMFVFKWSFKKSLMNTIYASTLAMIVGVLYMIISYLTKINPDVMDYICLAIIFIYIFMIIYVQNKDLRKKKTSK